MRGLLLVAAGGGGPDGGVAVLDEEERGGGEGSEVLLLRCHPGERFLLAVFAPEAFFLGGSGVCPEGEFGGGDNRGLRKDRYRCEL